MAIKENISPGAIQSRRRRRGALICGRCLDHVAQLFAPPCAEKPEALAGTAPLGQYHCPDCGTMLVAGIAHPWVCARCRSFVHPLIDGLPANRD